MGVVLVVGVRQGGLTHHNALQPLRVLGLARGAALATTPQTRATLIAIRVPTGPSAPRRELVVAPPVSEVSGVRSVEEFVSLGGPRRPGYHPRHAHRGRRATRCHVPTRRAGSAAPRVRGRPLPRGGRLVPSKPPTGHRSTFEPGGSHFPGARIIWSLSPRPVC